MLPTQSHSGKSVSADSRSQVFKFGPLRGRPEFYYEHVPTCQEDPNCFRSTCGYCHPTRDSQATHWAWVYPMDTLSREVKPVRSSVPVPPLLFGRPNQGPPLDPLVLSRDSSQDDSFILPNFDFLDNDVPHNPWGFTSSDLKSDLDGPPLRKVDSFGNKLGSEKARKRVRSNLRTAAPPFSPGKAVLLPADVISTSTAVIPSASESSTSLIPSIPSVSSVSASSEILPSCIPPAPLSEEKQSSIDDAFLRRMEVIKLAQQIESDQPSEPVKVLETPEQPKETRKTKKVKEMRPLPPLPAFKSKITTHTRTEQESLAPVLPLRGGSGTVTMESTKATPTKKSLPVVPLERDGSSQMLDSGAKPPSHAGWFLMVWSLVCSWLGGLGQDIKDMSLILWAAILIRLPFYNQSKPSQVHVKKPSARHLKTRRHSSASKSDRNEAKVRK